MEPTPLPQRCILTWDYGKDDFRWPLLLLIVITMMILISLLFLNDKILLLIRTRLHMQMFLLTQAFNWVLQNQFQTSVDTKQH